MSKVKPSEKLKDLQNFTSQLSLHIGVDFFNPQPKPNYKMILSTSVSLMWQGFVINSIIKDLPDLTVLTLSFVHLSFFSQGLTRTINLAINPLTTTNLRDTVLNYYVKRDTDLVAKTFLYNSINRTSKIVKAFLIFLALIFNSSLIILIISLITGTRLFLVPVFIPYTNASTLLSYLANIGLQIVLGAVGFFTFSSYDATILIYGFHTLTIIENLKAKIQNFQQELESTDRIKNMLLVDQKIKTKFVEFIKDYNDYKNYLKDYEKLIQLPFTAAIVVNIFGIFICLDYAICVDFKKGFGASLGLFIQLIMPFIVAVVLTLQRDELNSAIDIIPWNLLSSDSNKKMFMQFLTFHQHNSGICIPIFGTVDMKKIMKILSLMFYFGVHYTFFEWFLFKDYNV